MHRARREASWTRWHFAKGREHLTVDTVGNIQTESESMRSILAKALRGIRGRQGIRKAWRILRHKGWDLTGASDATDVAKDWWKQAAEMVRRGKLKENALAKQEEEYEEAETGRREDMLWDVGDAYHEARTAQLDYRVAVILMQMTAEAFINRFGLTQLNSQVWEIVDHKCRISEKWKTVPALLGHKLFADSREPLRSFNMMRDRRNFWIHSRPQLQYYNLKVSVEGQFNNEPMDPDYVTTVKFAESVVAMMLKINALVRRKPPRWIYEGMGEMTFEPPDELWDDSLPAEDQ